MGRTQQSANNSKSQWAREDAVGKGIGKGGYETHPINKASGETWQQCWQKNNNQPMIGGQ